MKNQRLSRPISLLVVAVIATTAIAPAAAHSPPPPHTSTAAIVNVNPNEAQWLPAVSYAYETAVLTVSGPDGAIERFEFPVGATPTLAVARAHGTALADGTYQYELLIVPAVGPEAKAVLAARAGDRDLVGVQRPSGPFVQAGALSVVNGRFVLPDVAEPIAARGMSPAGAVVAGPNAPDDQVIPDDLIVQSSLCVGLDCVNNENFGFDTVRLKENNLRIHFDDTSASVGFPANDWRIVANDSASGGANYLAVEDSTAGRQTFRLSAGAPSNSFFMDSSGRVGLGTSTPALRLHIEEGDTPDIRMEQNGSAGYPPQTWDIGANEVNFFVRDVTSGSRLPFRIQPGAPTNSLYIRSNGNVGLGHTTPTATLHLLRNDGTTQLFIQELSAVQQSRDLVFLRNATGGARARFVRGDNGADWSVGNFALDFRIDDMSDATPELLVSPAGNLTIVGTLTTGGPSCGGGCVQASEARAQAADVLSKLDSTPVLRFSSTESDPDSSDGAQLRATRLSPDLIAFFRAYGLGLDERSIAPMDVASVALASAQALKTLVEKQNATIDAQSARIAELEATLAALDARLRKLEQLAKPAP